MFIKWSKVALLPLGKICWECYTACQEAEDGFVVCLLRFAKIGQFRGIYTIKTIS